jgi:putative MATE family efflux protein
MTTGEEITRSDAGSEQALDPTSFRSIWMLAWPVAVSMGAHTAFAVVDMFWIGMLGTDALAAVSLIGNVVFCLFGLTQIVYAGALAMISRRVGAGKLQEREGATGIAAQALQLSLLLGIATGAAGLALARPGVELFGTSQPVTELSLRYLVPMLLSFLPLYPTMALFSFFTAAGDTRTPMIAGVVANLLNAALDPVFIFGWAGFPACGVAGAGIASLLCSVLGLVWLTVAYRASRLPFTSGGLLSWNGTRAWKTLLRIGIPASLAMLTRPASTVLLLGVIARFGSAGVAAFGVTVRALSLVWLYHGALATAVSTLSGQSLGSGNIRGIRVLVSKSIRLSLLISIAVGACYFVWPREIIAVFDRSSPEVLELGAAFMRLLVAANLATSFSVIWAAVLNGAGDTNPPMLIAVLANWAIKLPLAYALALPAGYGVEGIWWAMFISLIFESAATYVWYRRGRWMRTKV